MRYFIEIIRAFLTEKIVSYAAGSVMRHGQSCRQTGTSDIFHHKRIHRQDKECSKADIRHLPVFFGLFCFKLEKDLLKCGICVFCRHRAFAEAFFRQSRLFE